MEARLVTLLPLATRDALIKGEPADVAGANRVTVLLEVNAAGADNAEGDELDALVDMRWSGGAWLTVGRFPTIKGTSTGKWLLALERTAFGIVTLEVTGNPSPGTIRPGILWPRARAVVKLSGAGAHQWTYGVTAFVEW